MADKGATFQAAADAAMAELDAAQLGPTATISAAKAICKVLIAGFTTMVGGGSSSGSASPDDSSPAATSQAKSKSH